MEELDEPSEEAAEIPRPTTPKWWRPNCPPTTYLWEEMRRKRQQGGYPWTHLDFSNENYDQEHLYEPVNPTPLFGDCQDRDFDSDSLDRRLFDNIPPELDIITSEGLDGLDQPDPYDYVNDGEKEWRHFRDEEKIFVPKKKVFTAGIRTKDAIAKVGETSSARPLKERNGTEVENTENTQDLSKNEKNQDEKMNEDDLEMEEDENIDIEISKPTAAPSSNPLSQLKNQADKFKNTLSKISFTPPNFNNLNKINKLWTKKPKDGESEKNVANENENLENETIGINSTEKRENIKLVFDQTIDLTQRNLSVENLGQNESEKTKESTQKIDKIKKKQIEHDAKNKELDRETISPHTENLPLFNIENKNAFEIDTVVEMQLDLKEEKPTKVTSIIKNIKSKVTAPKKIKSETKFYDDEVENIGVVEDLPKKSEPSENIETEPLEKKGASFLSKKFKKKTIPLKKAEDVDKIVVDEEINNDISPNTPSTEIKNEPKLKESLNKRFKRSFTTSKKSSIDKDDEEVAGILKSKPSTSSFQDQVKEEKEESFLKKKFKKHPSKKDVTSEDFATNEDDSRFYENMLSSLGNKEHAQKESFVKLFAKEKKVKEGTLTKVKQKKQAQPKIKFSEYLRKFQKKEQSKKSKIQNSEKFEDDFEPDIVAHETKPVSSEQPPLRTTTPIEFKISTPEPDTNFDSKTDEIIENEADNANAEAGEPKNFKNKLKDFTQKSRSVVVSTSKGVGRKMQTFGTDIGKFGKDFNTKYHTAIKDMSKQEQERNRIKNERNAEKEEKKLLELENNPVQPKKRRVKKFKKENKEIKNEDLDSLEKPVIVGSLRKVRGVRQPENYTNKMFYLPPQRPQKPVKVPRSSILKKGDADWDYTLKQDREVSEERNASSGWESRPSSSRASSLFQQDPLLEQVDSDEFFLMEHGLSGEENEEEVNKFLMEEFRQAFRPVETYNALKGFDPPVKPVRQLKNTQENSNLSSNFQTFPPERPKRKAAPGYVSKYMSSYENGGEEEKNEGNEKNYDNESLSMSVDEYETVDNKPKRPERRIKSVPKFELNEHTQVFYNTIGGNGTESWMNDLEAQVTDEQDPNFVDSKKSKELQSNKFQQNVPNRTLNDFSPDELDQIDSLLEEEIQSNNKIKQNTLIYESKKKHKRKNPSPMFFSLPRYTPRTFHITPPKRPYRMYSSVRPKRPPRRKYKNNSNDPTTSGSNNVKNSSLEHKNDNKIPKESFFVRDKENKDPMRGRPLPPPPRPDSSPPNRKNNLDADPPPRNDEVEKRQYANFFEVNNIVENSVPVEEEPCTSKNIGLLGGREEENERINSDFLDLVQEGNSRNNIEDESKDMEDIRENEYETDEEERISNINDSGENLSAEEKENEIFEKYANLLDDIKILEPVEGPLSSDRFTETEREEIENIASSIPPPSFSSIPTTLHLTKLEVDFLHVNELSASSLNMERMNSSLLQVDSIRSAQGLSIPNLTSENLFARNLMNDSLLSPTQNSNFRRDSDNSEELRAPISNELSRRIRNLSGPPEVPPSQNDDVFNLGSRLGRALIRSGFRAIEGLSEYFESSFSHESENNEKNRTLQIMICILLLLITGIFLLSRTMAPVEHHWDFYLPPGNL